MLREPLDAPDDLRKQALSHRLSANCRMKYRACRMMRPPGFE